MTVKDFKEFFAENKTVKYFDQDGNDVSNLPIEILDTLLVVGSAHNADNTIDVDVLYIKSKGEND